MAAESADAIALIGNPVILEYAEEIPELRDDVGGDGTHVLFGSPHR